MGKNIFVSMAYAVLFILQTLVQHNQLQSNEIVVCDKKGRCTCKVIISGTNEESLLEVMNSDPISEHANKVYDITQLTARSRITGKSSRNMLPGRNQTNRMFDN
ncbi:hypothetical protein [Fulvivirga lutimaris]|uniref:hypothetical protein n=1 Tax=Fulvivirga lutimaris TaxID=1819566 RepID=UPI0012BB4B95|nr:hypothetical protein [Fulvivirga lutimaris]MTI39066.1 hypothetical protein [Fulvivirga lutimaris]